jgi:hypothetical protein
MNFLRSKHFALAVAGVTVAAFALAGGGPQALVVAIAVCGLLWVVLARRPNPEARLYRTLVHMAHGDRARAERLIALEAERAPNAPRRQHIANAIRRWERELN